VIPRVKIIVLGFSVVLAACTAFPADPSSTPASDQVEFFETKVRPVFADHCYQCHSEKAEKVKGGLRLDSADSISKGGSSGPSIVGGDYEGSLLNKANR